MKDIAFSSYLDALSTIGQRQRELEELLDDDSIRIRDQDSVFQDINVLCSLLTELRRLKRRLNADMSDYAATMNQQPDREKIARWNKDNARAVMILSDINAHYSSISATMATCRKWLKQPIYLYVLANPETGDVRYVGKTRDPESRLQEHLASPTNADMAKWFAELADSGLVPEIEIIEVVSYDNWQETEARQIWRYRQMGFNLLNREGPG